MEEDPTRGSEAAPPLRVARGAFGGGEAVTMLGRTPPSPCARAMAPAMGPRRAQNKPGGGGVGGRAPRGPLRVVAAALVWPLAPRY